MVKQKDYAKEIAAYIENMKQCDNDIPTLAGLAVFLNISKEKLLSFENCSSKSLRSAFILAKNQMEHLILSRSALKTISSSTAHFYLQSAFGYKEDKETILDADYKVDIVVEG